MFKCIYFGEHASENVFMKLKKIKNNLWWVLALHLKKTGFFNINIRKKWKCLFLFHNWFPMKFVSKYLLKLIKRRAKVQEQNLSRQIALNFDQWNAFYENYKPMRVWYGLLINLPRIIVACDFSPSSFKLKRGILPLLTKCVS